MRARDELAVDLVRDWFGEDVAAVCRASMRQRNAQLHELARTLHFDSNRTKAALLVLIQHGICTYYSTGSDDLGAVTSGGILRTFFDVDVDAIILRMRHPLWAKRVEATVVKKSAASSRNDEHLTYAVDTFRAFLVHGRLTLDMLYGQLEDQQREVAALRAYEEAYEEEGGEDGGEGEEDGGEGEAEEEEEGGDGGEMDVDGGEEADEEEDVVEDLEEDDGGASVGEEEPPIVRLDALLAEDSGATEAEIAQAQREVDAERAKFLKSLQWLIQMRFVCLAPPADRTVLVQDERALSDISTQTGKKKLMKEQEEQRRIREAEHTATPVDRREPEDVDANGEFGSKLMRLLHRNSFRTPRKAGSNLVGVGQAMDLAKKDAPVKDKVWAVDMRTMLFQDRNFLFRRLVADLANGDEEREMTLVFNTVMDVLEQSVETKWSSRMSAAVGVAQVEQTLRNTYGLTKSSKTWEKIIEPITRLGLLLKEGNIYRIDYLACGTLIRGRLVDSIIRARHGDDGARIVALLADKQMLDQKQVAEFAMMEAKPARQLLWTMVRDEVVQLQEVPRAPDHAPSRTFYLFHVNYAVVQANFAEEMYRVWRKLSMRKKNLREDNKGLLEAAAEDEINNTDEVREKLLTIRTKIAGLDRAMVLLHLDMMKLWDPSPPIFDTEGAD